MKPYAPTEGGVRLALRVNPRASRTGVDGVMQDAEGRLLLKLRLAAPPVDWRGQRGADCLAGQGIVAAEG